MSSLVSHNANLIRYQITEVNQDTANNRTAEQWKNWIRTALDNLDILLRDVLRQSSALVVIDVHTPPGGMSNNHTFAMFSTKPEMKKTLIQMWEEIALRYRDNNQIKAYGIINEPLGKVDDVNRLMRSAVMHIRAIDKDKVISITNQGSNPRTFTNMVALPDVKLWYEMHFYLPPNLTFQGIAGTPIGAKYPSLSTTKDTLKDYMARVRKFQLDHKVRIYVGEFSISSLADDQSRINYLSDCISIFEGYGWHWTYHAWRESHYWDVEPKPNVAAVLYNAWARNANGVL
jgi:hypothetical protein